MTSTERLRALAALRRGAPLHDSSATEAVWLEDAAAEIDRLRAQVAAMRKSLLEVTPLATAWAAYYKEGHGLDDFHEVHRQILDRARESGGQG